MSGVAGQAGPQQRPIGTDKTARLSPEVRRMLLTIQYERKMAGESLSFNEIIKRALTKAGMA